MHISPTVLQQLQTLLGYENVHTDVPSLLAYAYDCSLSRGRPDVILHLPDTACIAPVLRLLHEHEIPFVPRAAATNHAGSCAALKGGAVLNLTRLNHILRINTQERHAVVEPGVITGQLQQQLRPLGFFYAPDPASENISTLGGNFSQNASGARCMKYGGTLDHVLQANWVFPNGEETIFTRPATGPDWIGLLAGSEGTLGIATKLTVKILPLVQHIRTFLVTFPSLEDCIQTVTDLTAEGILLRTAEAMDQLTAQTVENFMPSGYPTQAAAVLLAELDGSLKEVQKDEKTFQRICQANHALQIQNSHTEEQRQRLWSGRRNGYSAMAHLAPNVMVGDGTVPRSQLPTALKKVRQILATDSLKAGLLFHAGDGNFHPQIVFDERQVLDAKRVSEAVRQILQVCIDCGGTVSGEHGVGVEKRNLMAHQYDASTLHLFSAVKKAIDPKGLANPLKIIPLQYAEKARAAEPLPPAVAKLAETILHYQEQKTPCMVCGLNSRLKTNTQPLLSSRDLNTICDIDLTNYTATAEAGVPIATLCKALAKKNVFCSLPQQDKGSLGGAFASACYPSFYKHVIGIEALMPDGSYIRYGGKLTKNAAGYNLVRLLAGSQGTLGLVTRLTFKIYAQKPAECEKKPFVLQPFDTLWQRIKNTLDPEHLFNTQRPLC